MAIATATFPSALAIDPTSFVIPITMASKPYNIKATWNNRSNNNAGAWFFEWQLSDGTVIIPSKKVVLDDDHFEPFHYLENVPPGRLQIRRADGSTADPGLADLAGAVLFEYITED